MSKIGLRSQIAEVERELALRVNVYRRETKPKKQAENELHMAHMRAVLATLRYLEGERVPDTMPRPGDLLAAMLTIRKRAKLHTAGDLGAHNLRDTVAGIADIVENALQGMVVAKDDA